MISFLNVEYIVFDFDGVFTNNKVFISEEGVESVVCDRGDGLGVSLLHGAEVPLLILSTEENCVVAARGRKLKIPVVQSVNNKAAFLKSFLQEKSVPFENVVYFGNDLNDLEVMKIVGIPTAPFDAHPEIIKIAKWVSSYRGGEGAVREFCELFLKERGLL